MLPRAIVQREPRHDLDGRGRPASARNLRVLRDARVTVTATVYAIFDQVFGSYLRLAAIW
jgi:hypothetical protein